MSGILALGVIGLIACSNSVQGDAQVRIGPGPSETLRQLLDTSALNGFGVAMVDSTGIRYAEGFGKAGNDRQYDVHTAQPIASISKTFIGIALMKAVEQGKVDLDAPIDPYLPFTVRNARFPERPITLRHLATHTAGIVDTERGYLHRAYVLNDTVDLQAHLAMDMDPLRFDPPDSSITMDRLLSRVLDPAGDLYTLDVYTEHPPGTRFVYSNLGATLAAYVLERAVGVPFHLYTRQWILEPLGMTDSYWDLGGPARVPSSQRFVRQGVAYPAFHLISYPDGGLVASAADMAAYLQELLLGLQGRGSLLSASSYAEYFRAQLDSSHYDERRMGPFHDDHNMGIFIGHSAAGYIGHTGGDPGVASLFFLDPKTGTGRYLAVNTDLTDAQEFWAIWDQLKR